jgi:hypothetical protein
MAGAVRPAPVDGGIEALAEFGNALQRQQQAGQRHGGLEGPGDGHPRAADEALAGHEGLEEVTPAEIQEDRGEGHEHDDVADGIDDALGARRPAAVQRIGADVALGLQRVGRAEHEEGAVEHEGHVVGPQRRGVEDIARHDLIDEGQHHGDDQPGRQLAGPDGDRIELVRDPHQ